MTELPIELQALIQRLLVKVREQHDLDAAARQAVYEAMGPWQRGSVGHRRRTRLAIASARRVLPLVECLIPGSMSRALILLAQQVLKGHQDATDASLLLMQRWRAWLDEDLQAARELLRCYRPIGSRGAAETLETVDQVARAAKQALEVAVWDECDVGECMQHYPGTTLDYWRSFDAVVWAWLAERGKDAPATYQQNGDAFWEWYLRVAAAQAWTSEVE